MFAKRLAVLLFIFICFVQSRLYAQDDFCEAVSVILKDAPNQFRNVHGNPTQTSVGLKIYKTAIIVPGTISSRFVASQGLFYEGALCQSKNLDTIKKSYIRYKKQLEACLSPHGLNMKLNDNFYPGLSEYKKVVFLPAYNVKEGVKSLKGHVTMEVDFNKESGIYTLIFYIFEH